MTSAVGYAGRMHRKWVKSSRRRALDGLRLTNERKNTRGKMEGAKIIMFVYRRSVRVLEVKQRATGKSDKREGRHLYMRVIARYLRTVFGFVK